MALTEKDISEFKKLYKEHYGEEINDFVAYEAANHLVQMIKAVYKPIPKADEELYNKLKKEHEAVPESEKIDFVKHLVEDAKVTEFKTKISEKKFWELVRKARGMDVAIKKSKISGKGVFALRDFKNGEVVLRWNPKLIKKSEINSLSTREKTYIVNFDKKYFLMQSPERYVNHSCEANTTVKNNSDVAVKNIKKGEEITSDYIKTQGGVSFQCKCGSKKCRKIIF